MTPVAALTIAGCIAVNAGTDRISVRDLLPAFPGLPESAGDAVAGFAPAPGVRRIFTLAELRRVAARLQITAIPEREICFERTVAPLEPNRLLAAMQKSMPQAHIEVLGCSRQPAPEGKLEFPAGGLRQTGNGEFWTGSVRYGGGRHFTIWAKVRVRVASPRVVATSDLPAGRALEAGQLHLETDEAFPGAGEVFDSVKPLVGRVLRRAVRRGTILRPQWLDVPKDIARGDTVRVEVRSGSARLEMQAVAEAGGSAGQSITVRNPQSKKIFRARVEGKGKVSVGL
jgi:flagella basal body P-ring formation protein FlgA